MTELHSDISGATAFRHDEAEHRRAANRSLILDVTGAVDAGVTVREADQIGHAVRRAVLDAVEEARAVTWAARAG